MLSRFPVARARLRQGRLDAAIGSLSDRVGPESFGVGSCLNQLP